MKEPKNKRLVIILPADKFDEFQARAESQYETMSAIGRRLILEWIEQQEQAGRPPPPHRT